DQALTVGRATSPRLRPASNPVLAPRSSRIAPAAATAPMPNSRQANVLGFMTLTTGLCARSAASAVSGEGPAALAPIVTGLDRVGPVGPNTPLPTRGIDRDVAASRGSGEGRSAVAPIVMGLDRVGTAGPNTPLPTRGIDCDVAASRG